MATHPIPERLHGFAAKLESTGGSAETISKSTDAIQLAEPSTIEWLAVEGNRRENVVAGSLNMRPVAPGDPSGVYGRVNWRLELRGTNAAYSASTLPPADPLLIAGGMARTVTTTSGSESVAYDPSDDPNTGTDDTVTMEVQTANKEYVLKGGVTESLRIECTAGGIAYLVGSTIGVYDSDTEQSLESHTYSTTDLAIWSNSGPLDISGTTSIIGKRFVLDYNLSAAVRAAPDADGLAAIVAKITGRNPTLEIEAETLAKSTWDPDSDWRNSTAKTADIVVGDSQYNRFDVDIDAMYSRPPALSPQDELMRVNVVYDIGTGGTNEARILFD